MSSRGSIMIAGEIVKGTITKNNKLKVNEAIMSIEQVETSYGKLEDEPISYVVLQVLGCLLYTSPSPRDA